MVLRNDHRLNEGLRFDGDVEASLLEWQQLVTVAARTLGEEKQLCLRA